MGEPVDVGIEAANAVTETFRQHRDDAIRQVDTVAALVGFAIERAAGRHVRSHVRDVHAESPAAAGNSFDVDCVVEVPRVIRIDRDDEFVPKILTAFEHLLRHGFRNLVCFFDHGLRKFRRQMVFPVD